VVHDTYLYTLRYIAVWYMINTCTHYEIYMYMYIAVWYMINTCTH